MVSNMGLVPYQKTAQTMQQSIQEIHQLLQNEVVAAMGRSVTNVNKMHKVILDIGRVQKINWGILKSNNTSKNWLREMILTIMKAHNPNYQGHGGDRCSKKFENSRNALIQEAIKKSALMYKEQQLDPVAVVSKCKDDVRNQYLVHKPEDQVVLDRYVEYQVHEALGIEKFGREEGKALERRFRYVVFNKRTSTVRDEIGSEAVSSTNRTTVFDTCVQHNKAILNDSGLLLQFFKVEHEENTKQVVVKVQAAADVEKAKIDGEVQKSKHNADARQAEAQSVTAKAKAQSDAEIAKAESDARVAEANAKMRIRELDLEILRERAPRADAKRKRPNTLEEFARPPWCNQTCLSVVAWDARPEGTTDTIETIFRRLHDWAKAHQIPHRTRLPKEFPGVSMVYVNANADVEAWLRTFWVPAPSPETTAPVTISQPNAVPNNRGDLVTLLLPHWPANRDTPAQRRQALTHHLHAGFVRPLCQNGWELLFELPVLKTKIISHIDTRDDPIVPALAQWVASGCVSPAPSYPCNETADPRPPEDIPDALRDVSGLDVVPLLESAGLGSFCARHRTAYTNSMAQSEDVAAALAPRHHEILRQWRRITGADPHPSFKEVSTCLGWNVSPNDAVVVKLLVQRLMHPVPLTDWYDATGRPSRWNVNACLWPMRMAALYVARLCRGGADLQYAAKDLQGIIAPL